MRDMVTYPGEDGFWVAECPSLPGCISQGESREEAVVNVKEAIEAYIETFVEDNLPVPEEYFKTVVPDHKPLDRSALHATVRQTEVTSADLK